MKHFFTFLIAFAAAASLAHAQTFSDDFESYAPGAFIAQSSTTWATWSGANGGGLDDATVSNANAHSGTNSLKLASTAVGGGPDDIVLPFGQVYSTGTFTFNTWMFVDSGKNAYMNYQASTTVGQIWSMDVNFEANGELKFSNGGVLLLSVPYTQGAWFEFTMTSNLNNSTWAVLIDGVSVGTFQNPVFNIASINFYPIQNSSYYIDDVSFDHIPYTAPALNAAVMNLNVENGLASQTRQPTVDVRNLGTTAITSFDLAIDYNGVQTTQSFTGVNYAPGSVNTVTLSQAITLAGGSLPTTVTISNVNGNATDDDSSDDEAFANVTAVMPAPGKTVVAEEATGTWCSWCPRGAVYMDWMAGKYPGFFAGIAVHNADPMAHAAYDAGIAPFIAGYPSALVDRLPEIDPSEIEQDFLERIVVAPKVFLTNGALYNSATRELKVSVKANWQEAVNGSDYKLAIVLTENDVTGTGSGWSQANSYAGGSQGVMGGFELLPNPVPASQMVYNHVGRFIFPSWNGFAAYSGAVNNGDEMVNTATFTLPAGWDDSQIHIIGMVIFNNGSSTIIDNASHTTIPTAVSNGYISGTEIPSTLGIALVESGADIALHPNPSSDQTQLNINLTEPSDIIVSVFGVEGKLLQSKHYGTLSGSNALPLASQLLTNGVYIVEVSVNGNKQALKLVKH